MPKRFRPGILKAELVKLICLSLRAWLTIEKRSSSKRWPKSTCSFHLICIEAASKMRTFSRKTAHIKRCNGAKKSVNSSQTKPHQFKTLHRAARLCLYCLRVASMMITSLKLSVRQKRRWSMRPWKAPEGAKKKMKLRTRCKMQQTLLSPLL